MDVGSEVKILEANVNGSSDAVTEVVHEAVINDDPKAVVIQSKELLNTESSPDSKDVKHSEAVLSVNTEAAEPEFNVVDRERKDTSELR